MALYAHLQVEGDSTGGDQGLRDGEGRRGPDPRSSPRSTRSRGRSTRRGGVPTSRRKHSPFKVTKEVDRASPLLYSALVSSERFTSGSSSSDGFSQETAEEQNHYTVTLSNSVIIEIASVMPNNKDPDLTKLEQYEVVSFLYQRIRVGLGRREGLTSEDDWADVA